MKFIPVISKLNFLASSLQSHDPSEIIVIFWFAGQKNDYYYQYLKQLSNFFQDSLRNRKIQISAFIIYIQYLTEVSTPLTFYYIFSCDNTEEMTLCYNVK